MRSLHTRSRWTKRVVAAAALTGGFWLMGQAAAQADSPDPGSTAGGSSSASSVSSTNAPADSSPRSSINRTRSVVPDTRLIAGGSVR